MLVRKIVSLVTYVLTGVLYLVMLLSAMGQARALLVALAIFIVAFPVGTLAISRKNKILGAVTYGFLMLSIAVVVYRFWEFIRRNQTMYAFLVIVIGFSIAYTVALL